MILNGLSEQFYITNTDEKTLFVNQAYCEATNLAPERYPIVTGNNAEVDKKAKEALSIDHSTLVLKCHRYGI